MASQCEQETNQLSTTIVDLDDLSLTDSMHFSDCPATKLPVEVVIHLMKFLSYPDRIAASQTCQLWYEALRYPKFIKQEKVLVKKNVTSFQAVFQTSSRPYPHLVLIEVEISPKARDFWLKIAPGLKSLYLSNCDMCENMFVDLLSRCRQLESLALDNCRELFMPGRLLAQPDDANAIRKTLQGVRELNLSFNRYLCDSLLNRLVRWMVNLETISLEGCQISYHIGLYNKYYPERITSENPDFASDTVLTFRNFCKIVEQRSKTVQVINLSDTLLDSTALCSIAEMKGLRLSELHLTGCEQLTNAGVTSLVRLQPQLSELDVSRCVRITDQALLNVCAGLPRLRRLRVRSCRAITDRGIEQLRRLECLDELDISSCEQVTGEGIEKGLCYRVNKGFRRLIMEGLASVTSGTVISIAKNLPHLTHLGLSYCSNAVTDTSIQAIFGTQRRLRWLRLAGCKQLTDAGLTGLGVELVSEAEVQAVVAIVDEAARNHRISLGSRAEQEILRDAQRNHTVRQLCEIRQSDVSGYSLTQLTGLQDLDLRCCNKISDVSLKYAFSHLELQHLNLSQCQQITVDGLRELGSHCPSIDTLSLAHCYNIADDGIHTVVEQLKRLKYLDIRGCNQLTGATIDAIVRYCRQLRYLDATSCEKMAAAIKANMNRLPAQTLYSQTELSPGNRPHPPPMPR